MTQRSCLPQDEPVVQPALEPVPVGEEPVPEDIWASWSGTASPDGTRVAFVSDRSGTPALWVHGPAGLRPVPSGWGRLREVSWSPDDGDGGWLACLTAAPGASRTELWLVRPDGSEPHRVAGADGTAQLGAGSGHGWTADGRLLVTETTPSGDGVDQTCCLISPSGAREILDSGAHRLLLDHRAGVALVRVGPRGRRHLEVVTAGGRRVVLGTGEGGLRWPGLADRGFLTPDGTGVYARSSVGRERFALVRIDVATGARQVVAERDDAELEDAVTAPGGGRAVLLWNVAGGCSAIELLDLRTLARQEVPDLPRDVVDECRLTPAGDAVLLTGEDWADSRGVWRLDLAGLRARPLSAPDDGSVRGSRGATVPRVPTSALTSPRLLRLAARDGLELSGWLYPTGEAAPGPAVIWLHGGPESQERPVYNSLFQGLVAEGVAVFALNFRGSTGLGRAFLEADDGAGRFGAIDDVADAAGHLVAAGVARAGRVGVLGRSYGGYLTMAALAWHPSLFAAGVAVCGMSDFHTFYADTEPWIAAAATSEYGDPVADADLLRELSPIHRSGAITAPLLLVHGEEDTNVPVGESRRMAAALAARAAPHRLLLFPGEGHELLATQNRVAFVRETVAWLTHHLG